ncbi:UDP-glucose 4-epimerase GalE [Nocardioides limicola]|uniref:UDP-glucose 4-epimerase GalE n=1 Tax=Nocardioides limicola TaxID=2803368 RepID=UPI00193B6ADB|nr:UDP-glucose 4-epimerase GalE [Nocardioides sp. DJM-14]
MRVLVAGGAGYIGSHTVLSLVADGHEVVIADDFSNAKPTVLPRLEELAGTTLTSHRIDLTDRVATDRLFATERLDAVIHFAGLKAVGESAEKPLAYYDTNLSSTFSLLAAMRAHDVRRFVFSSSATVYGDSAPVPYHEDYRPLDASSPYGSTKVMIERVLSDVAHAEGFRVALLRYFNPVGAHESGTIGEDPQGIPNNLMPFIAQVAVGRRERLTVFGADYPTLDGTCRRDYIHVADLADGHVAALDHLDQMSAPVRAFNLGSGEPSSVLEMIAAFERASGRQIPYDVGPRRAGDLAEFWGDPARAATELGWRTSRSIDDMCADTWRWQSANPHGYPDA